MLGVIRLFSIQLVFMAKGRLQAEPEPVCAARLAELRSMLPELRNAIGA